MSTKKIYLIRHGETEFNRQGIVQGSGVDSDLNELGFRQAQAFFEMYGQLHFDKVYTSKLRRSMQSVQKFIDLDIPHEMHAGLNEISWGKKEGQGITPEEDTYYHFMLHEWRSGVVNLSIEGGESPLQVAERQRPVIDLIISRPEEEQILVCMHGRAMRILLCQLMKKELKEMDFFEHENLCLYLVHYNYQDNNFEIIKSNDREHLKDLK